MDIGKLDAELLFKDLVNPDFHHRSDVALMMTGLASALEENENLKGSIKCKDCSWIHCQPQLQKHLGKSKYWTSQIWQQTTLQRENHQQFLGTTLLWINLCPWLNAIKKLNLSWNYHMCILWGKWGPMRVNYTSRLYLVQKDKESIRKEG